MHVSFIVNYAFLAQALFTTKCYEKYLLKTMNGLEYFLFSTHPPLALFIDQLLITNSWSGVFKTCNVVQLGLSPNNEPWVPSVTSI
jgi:hypothetical protein